jgi:hypothetical protein
VTHYGEDDLILYYYGEGRRRADIERHLDACGACAATYRTISHTLALIGEPEIPERGERYGLEVWQRIRHQLPLQDAAGWMAWFKWDRLALAGSAAALCALIVAAFVAGRLWSPAAPATRPPVQLATDSSSGDAGARIRLAAIGDHLERSERVLLDVVNASGAEGAHVDVTDAQSWASDLVDANRFYRDAALRAGDTMVAGVLDDLEGNLLEIIHGPSTLTPAQLEQLRVRLDAAALLFKVRVLHDELREREAAPAIPRKTT